MKLLYMISSTRLKYNQGAIDICLVHTWPLSSPRADPDYFPV